MSGFSWHWLKLREEADHRSRDHKLLQQLSLILEKTFDKAEDLQILDLGSGTGSNLRAMASFLSPSQEWTLVDYDHSLLQKAEELLLAWADKGEKKGEYLKLEKNGKNIKVSFKLADLNKDISQLLSKKPNLVTASALFDLISSAWIDNFVQELASIKAIFYTVLIYNGEENFSPPHNLDCKINEAFIEHQERDKGFGYSSGSKAAKILENAFKLAQYATKTAQSPWKLTHSDIKLAKALLLGIANASEETNLLAKEDVEKWLKFRQDEAFKEHSTIEIGHTDILAFPAK